jgi:hypothetical protein
MLTIPASTFPYVAVLLTAMHACVWVVYFFQIVSAEILVNMSATISFLSYRFHMFYEEEDDVFQKIGQANILILCNMPI